jgi:hypothetical protein
MQAGQSSSHHGLLRHTYEKGASRKSAAVEWVTDHVYLRRDISPSPEQLHTRRIALFQLEEYESAKESLEISLSLERKRETESWLRKCQAELEGNISWFNTRAF